MKHLEGKVATESSSRLPVDAEVAGKKRQQDLAGIKGQQDY